VNSINQEVNFEVIKTAWKFEIYRFTPKVYLKSKLLNHHNYDKKARVESRFKAINAREERPFGCGATQPRPIARRRRILFSCLGKVAQGQPS
jgi:hypothetical protein